MTIRVSERCSLRYSREKNLGIALPFVLMVIALLLITVSTVATNGLGSLSQAKTEQFRKQAFFAAEAGAADALRQLVEDPSWAGPLPQTDLEFHSSYSATVVNNIAGTSGPLTAANGASVPEGHAYILATGIMGRSTRRVGLLVSPGSSTAFGIAVGVGGDAYMQGSKRVAGSMKASGTIELQGSTRITPLDGSGRLLAGVNVESQGSTRVDASQDVRARGTVSATPAIRGALEVQGSDTTDSTLPFIADGRTTNSLNAGESGLVLPNPDQAVLLDPTNPNLVTHGDASNQEDVTGVLDLANQIHYYPGGVNFAGSSSVIGQGTIVVGNGNTMEFQGSTTINGNLIALRSDGAASDGNPSINFQGSTTVNGLIYAHEDVNIQGSFTLNGVVIAYRDGGGDLDTQGSTRITLDSSVFGGIPGFESWAAGFGGVGGAPAGSGALSILSWERL